MKHFAPSAFAHIFFKERPKRGLRLVSFEGSNLGFQVITYINDCSLRRKRNRLPVGQRKFGGRIVQLLRPVRARAVMELICISIGASSPVKSERGKRSGHGMIGMSSHSAFRA